MMHLLNRSQAGSSRSSHIRACVHAMMRKLKLKASTRTVTVSASHFSLCHSTAAAAAGMPVPPAPSSSPCRPHFRADVLVPQHHREYVGSGRSPYSPEQLAVGERHRAALPTQPDPATLLAALRTPGLKEGEKFVEPVYDAAVHLQLEAPPHLVTLNFDTLSVGAAEAARKRVCGSDREGRVRQSIPGEETLPSDLAYTAAFRVLSDEGIRVLRAIISSNVGLVQSSARIPCLMRNLGYVSEWVRRFNECPVLLSHLSKLAGMQLQPSYHHGTYSHTNIGVLPPAEEMSKPSHLRRPNLAPVDQWHVDAVPFVLILILSDMEGMEGGELECVRRKGKEAGMKLIADTNNNVPEEDLLRVSYERMGYALFMQGCEIVHHVTPVLKAKEPRVTVVNSYMPISHHVPDRHVYAMFAPSSDPKDFSIREGAFEYARGKSMRIAQRLFSFAKEDVYEESPLVLAQRLEQAQMELAETIQSLKVKPDRLAWFEERKNQGGDEGVFEALREAEAEADCTGEKTLEAKQIA